MIIGISGKKLSGKDTLCTLIRSNAVPKSERIAFADALKEEVGLACGVSVNFIEQNKTQFRPILQWWGTDFRRHFNGPEYWVEQAMFKMHGAIDNGNHLIIIPDVRFKSEAAMIKELGGIILRIARPTQVIDPHPSENDLDDYKGFYDIVLNSGTITDLEKEAVSLLNKLKIKTK